MRRGQRQTPEAKAKVAAARVGRKHSAATREKIKVKALAREAQKVADRKLGHALLNYAEAHGMTPLEAAQDLLVLGLLYKPPAAG